MVEEFHLEILLIVDSWVFDNAILADELFIKALQTLETFLPVNNSLCKKLASPLESPITID